MPKTKQIIEYRKYNLDHNFPVMLLLDGKQWEISDNPSDRLHFHDCMEIGVCLQGSGYMRFRGENLRFQEGDVTVIPENIPHTTFSDPGTSSYWCYLMMNPWGFFKGLLPITNKEYNLSSLSLETFRFILRQNEYPEVIKLLHSAIRELTQKRIGYEASARGLLLALYIEIYRAEKDPCVTGIPVSSSSDSRNDRGNLPPSHDNRLAIAPALDYITQNYMQQFTVEDLAEMCHMSDTHFRRTFREIMNTAPLDYLHNTRITRACLLLGSTQKSILEISEQVGYHTLSSFNRHFQQIMNTTPRDYRREITLQEKAAQETAIYEYSGWVEPQV